MPECLHHLVASYAFERASLGQAAETYRLVASDRPTRYLKIAPDLEREHERLRWAEELIPVPHLVAFAKHAQRDYLLLDELPGTPVAIATSISVADRVVHVARTLRELHAMSASSCPFDARVETRLVDAEANVRAGLVDESDFDSERVGRSAQSVFDELRVWPAFAEDLVVTHGDFTLSNILVHPTGMLDLGASAWPIAIKTSRSRCATSKVTSGRAGAMCFCASTELPRSTRRSSRSFGCSTSCSDLEARRARRAGELHAGDRHDLDDLDRAVGRHEVRVLLHLRRERFLRLGLHDREAAEVVRAPTRPRRPS